MNIRKSTHKNIYHNKATDNTRKTEGFKIAMDKFITPLG